jgi:hypothetical protein
VALALGGRDRVAAVGDKGGGPGGRLQVLGAVHRV